MGLFDRKTPSKSDSIRRMVGGIKKKVEKSVGHKLDWSKAKVKVKPGGYSKLTKGK